MRVKLLVGLAGPTFTLNPGDIYDCEDSEGVRLISARYAIPHVVAEVETAVDAPITEKRGKRKK